MELNEQSGDGIKVVYSMHQLGTTHHLSCLIVVMVQGHGLNEFNRLLQGSSIDLRNYSSGYINQKIGKVMGSIGPGMTKMW